MKIQITEEAEIDLADGFWFYERQTPGLGDYFRSSLIADIDSLAFAIVDPVKNADVFGDEFIRNRVRIA